MSKSLRYAAVPLVTIDPYLSIWSASNHLYDDVTRHWTDRRSAMSGFVKVDGKWFRFMGTVKTERCRCVKEPKGLPQKHCHVTATQSVYDFENELLKLRVTFTSPLLMDDLLLMSRPVSYISYELEYLDGHEHDTQVYFDVSSDICVENANTELEFIQTNSFVSCGRNTNVLERSGDDVLIDWGYLYLLAPDAVHRIYDEWQRVGLFVWKQNCTGIQEKRKVADGHPVLSALRDFGNTKKAEGFICIAYDDLYSIEYFGKKLKGFWTANGDDFNAILKKAVEEYDVIKEKCDAFDLAFRNKTSLVSEKYADLACLAYRQVIAGHKLVHQEGKPLFFSKECGSNGCIGTVDITYPSMPLFMVYSPCLIKAMLEPVFEYAKGAHGWEFEFAPHDVGQYPKANGQVYGMESADPDYIMAHQMPIEECGNMLLCMAAACKAENDFEYAMTHFAVLKQWADYLVRTGWNPQNQLCTDDFAGHMAHNCNLAIKAILGIAAFGYICNQLGVGGESYFQCAKDYAKNGKQRLWRRTIISWRLIRQTLGA